MYSFAGMNRAVIYFFAGTLISFLLNHYVFESLGWVKDLFNAAAFGLGWGMAYFVDRPEWPLTKKMGISLIGIALLLLVGFIFLPVR